jgi:hypothetical protein
VAEPEKINPKPKSFLSPHQPAILAALQYQGFSNDCGPYTTATVLNGIKGLQIDPAALAEEMNRPRWHGPIPLIRRIPRWATFPWGIVDELRSHGLNAGWRLFAREEHLLEGLDQGRVLMPVIGSWRPLWAHVMTLVVWDAERGWGFANTQRSDHSIDWFEHKRFIKQWRAMGRLLIEVLDVDKRG